MELKVGIASFILSLILVPFAKYLSYILGTIDEPSKGIHRFPTPRLGGLAVMGAIAISLLFLGDKSIFSEFRVRYALLSFGLVYLLGLADDLLEVRARVKMAIIVLLILPLSLLYVPPYLSLALHICYSLLALILFLGAINAINFIDGMDGLAPGLCLLSFLSFFFLLSSVGDKGGALLAISCVFSLLGFLFYNWHPASIFMGDGGNYALGFLLAFLSYRLWLAEPNIRTLLAILFLLFMPAYDLILTVVRRIINHRSLFVGDFGHSYHKLWRDWGWEYKTVVFFFLICQAIFCLFAFVVFFLRSFYLTLLLLILALSFSLLLTHRYRLTSIAAERKG
jgi:UDP-GlcNAc:undecaprenyl-phosphate GlcNAc-1-phosphate transferase